MNAILAVIGVIGLGTIISGAAYFRTLTRAQAFLRLGYRAPADIVLTTSSMLDRGPDAGYRRVLTSVGNLRAASDFSREIGAIRARNEIRIRLSTEIDNTLDSDLIVIGGPQRNIVAQHFLAHLVAQYPELGLVFEDRTPDRCRVALGTFAAEYEQVDQCAFPGIPETDVALLVLWINPFATARRRGVLCAGFTSHGTAAAAQYLLGDFMTYRWRQRRRRILPGTRFAKHEERLPSVFGWAQFAAVLKVTMVGDKPIDIKELAFAPLRPVRAPLPAMPAGVVMGSTQTRTQDTERGASDRSDGQTRRNGVGARGRKAGSP